MDSIYCSFYYRKEMNLKLFRPFHPKGIRLWQSKIMYIPKKIYSILKNVPFIMRKMQKICKYKHVVTIRLARYKSIML